MVKNQSQFKQTEAGLIPEDWEVKPISDFCEQVSSGGTPSRAKKEFWENGTIFWVKTKELNDGNIYETEEKINEMGLKNSAAKIFPENSVLLAMYGATVGKLGILQKEMTTNQACCVMVSDKNKSDYRYLYYQLLNNRNYLINLASGAAQQNLNVGLINRFLLPYPKPEEQKKIAGVLGALDEKIELNRKMNKTLEQIGQAIFKRWFVDFEFPNENGKAYKSSGGKMIDSEFGEIPLDWKIVPFENFFDFLEGPGIRNWQYAADGTRFMNIRLIDNGDIDVKAANYINQNDVDTKYKHFLLQEKDMVISTSGTLGRSAIVRKSHLPLLLNTSVIRFRPKDKESYPFMYQYLQSEYFLGEQTAMASGSVQANFGPTHLKRMVVLMPEKKNLDSLNQILNFIYGLLVENMDQIDTLSKVRDSLLPRLMSGKLRVR